MFAVRLSIVFDHRVFPSRLAAIFDFGNDNPTFIRQYAIVSSNSSLDTSRMAFLSSAPLIVFSSAAASLGNTLAITRSISARRSFSNRPALARSRRASDLPLASSACCCHCLQRLSGLFASSVRDRHDDSGQFAILVGNLVGATVQPHEPGCHFEHRQHGMA